MLIAVILMAVIGRITVPVVNPVGTFPLTTQYPVELAQDFRVVEHVMDSAPGNLKISQRFLIGTGRPVHTFRRNDLTHAEASTLKSFYDTHKANHVPFTYPAPNADNATFTDVTAVFAPEPLSIVPAGPGRYSAELRIIEIPTTVPQYPLNSTVTRFPTEALETALAAQAQELIPLIHIVVREPGHPDNVFLSDRACKIGAQMYQPRLLENPEVTQAIDGQSDVSRFVFGNADRVMRDFAYDTELDNAAISYSLYHVGTGIKIDVWLGRISRISGLAENEFTVEATDPIDLTVQYPPREISHHCWKIHNDGINCVAPGLATCDKTYTGPNGCIANGNQRQFGGHFAEPELVQIKDNSTGLLGAARRTVTPSSMIADTVYGEVLPLHFTDAPMKVNCRVLAGRDEGEFFIALGIVGQGPVILSQNALDHRLNGQSAHGPGILGFRASEGADPLVAGEGIFPADNDHYFQLDQSGAWPPAAPVFSAGTAFCTIRITDAKGIQPRAATEHQMQVTVVQGVGTWYWEAPGDRQHGPGMSNPVWVAVHCLLDALGLRLASAATQEAVIDIDAAVATAAVNATVVSSLIIGDGTETQFKFQGTVGDRFALRDWLSNICTSFLGYYTFAYGKFRIGSRINSSTVEAFTQGNVIRDSVRIERDPPQFNTLTIEYADKRYDWARNTVVTDFPDHVKKYGRRTTSMNMPGCANRGEALRLGTIRIREELGGITESEWKKRIRGSFATTVLGLGTEPGQVVSLTHPEMPGGTGELRIQRWTLRPDLALVIDGKTSTDSMYDLLVGPKPVDVQPDPLPVERIEEILPVQPWFAYTEFPDAADPLYDPTDALFRVTQEYGDGADATALARIIIEGAHPVTRVMDCDPPRIDQAATDPAGGSIPRGLYVTCVLVATNVDGSPTRASRAIGVQVAGDSDTNRIVLSGITWPEECAGGGYRLYAAVDRALLSEQLASDSTQPASITLSTLPNYRTRGIPQERLAGLVPRIRKCWHLGINGLPVTEVAGATLRFEGAGWTPDEYAGRKLGIFADQSDGSAPLWHFSIDSNTADTLTLNRDVEAAGVQVGDVASILLEADIVDAFTIGDSKLPNPQYPTGLAEGEEAGRVALIVSGPGAGQQRLIKGNSATELVVAPAWDVLPEKAWFVILSAGVDYQGETIRLAVGQDDTEISAALPIENLDGQTLMVEVVSIDANGRESEPHANPKRFIYAFGSPGGLAQEVRPALY